jgi:tRNA (guanosine-2'-O-)-methyltransferase
MRGRSANIAQADELFGAELDGLASIDPEIAIAQLEPLVTPERRLRLSEVIGKRLASVTVLMDAPHDPHNGAAVIRSCDAFGVQRLHVVERREPFMVATSVAKGSHKWVDVVTYPTVSGAVEVLQQSGFQLVAADASGDLQPDELRRIDRLALVLGNERDGIGADLRRSCAHAVRVPMRGFAESINLSVCAALLLSRAVEDRPGDLSDAERRRLYARGLFLTVHHAAEILLGR